jgi:hypothetical protein
MYDSTGVSVAWKHAYQESYFVGYTFIILYGIKFWPEESYLIIEPRDN